MKYAIILLMAIAFCSCGSNDKSKTLVAATPVTNKKILAADSTRTVSQPSDSISWMDDLTNFRTALQQNDVSKMAEYFNFPFEDQGSVIWHLCDLSEEDLATRKQTVTNPDLFYKKDLELYHEKVFNQHFKELLAKLDMKKLYRSHTAESPEVVATDGIYKLYADYSKVDGSLSLNMSVGNNMKDEDGEYMSEGEYNIIYSFKIINNKKLVLSRLDMAG